ncbi:MAG: hypothetical protein KAI66_01720, partial [Lentisphaeria bacterium]|nr:hypothetical protein [Lentisphaeria bacterium]
MRTARIRHDRELSYYHILNRVAGEPGYFPFGDMEKEYFIRRAQKLARFYTIEILSLVVMGNHWHAVCATYPELPGIDEMRKRFRAYYGSLRAEPNWDDPGVCERLGRRMRDISQFAKDLQQSFTTWFNSTRKKQRRGTLWAGRYKNVLIEGKDALWACIQYIEMNPVRAKLCD